eukprot:1892810-Pyramimonas_sp.AAC.1
MYELLIGALNKAAVDQLAEPPLCSESRNQHAQEVSALLKAKRGLRESAARVGDIEALAMQTQHRSKQIRQAARNIVSKYKSDEHKSLKQQHANITTT